MDFGTTIQTLTTLAAGSISDYQSTFFWVVIVGFFLAFTLGFGMGANDVSNAFGTSVGSKVLTIRQAYVLASISETLGAILVGYNVTDTMRKGIVDIKLYANRPAELLIGQVAILGGGSCWLILATALRAPVSTTHSLIGATLGFTLLMRGTDGIQWGKVTEIVSSWILSPLLSGLTSVTLYMIVDFAVLRRRNPLKCGLRMLPIFYFFCIAFNTFAISYQGSKILNLSSIPLGVALAISCLAGFFASLLVHFFLNPRLLRWIQRTDSTLPLSNTTCTKMSTISDLLSSDSRSNSVSAGDKKPPTKGYGSAVGDVTNGNVRATAMANITTTPIPTEVATTTTTGCAESGGQTKPHNARHQHFHPSPKGFVRWFLPTKSRVEDENTLKLFSSIQVFTACFAGFAHGANDVGNAIGPLTALVSIYGNMDVFQMDPTPLYILSYGVLAICCGLWLVGHRVIRTVGQRMSDIHPASGFTIEFGAALSALICSKLGLPISTTHCLVGSVMAVGSVKAGEGVHWRIFIGIALSWVVTLPVSGTISALIMIVLRSIFL